MSTSSLYTRSQIPTPYSSRPDHRMFANRAVRRRAGVSISDTEKFAAQTSDTVESSVRDNLCWGRTSPSAHPGKHRDGQEVDLVDNVVLALRHKQRARARRAAHVATLSISTDTDVNVPELVRSTASSPASSGPPTPVIPDDSLANGFVDFPEISLCCSSHASPTTPHLNTHASNFGVKFPRSCSKRPEAREKERATSRPPCPSTYHSRPSRSRSSIWRQSLSRSSTPHKPSPQVPSPVTTSSKTIDVLIKRLPPLPRFNPFVRMRSESLSSIMHLDKWTISERQTNDHLSSLVRPRRKSTSMLCKKGSGLSHPAIF
ncbi:hypothetical protein AcW1_000979 [Taiwanofungus camphoratus]|nr:hypothetical protein AcW2_000526 [Antrodia cinnamomea]KAI0936848.1 hypothetical protein AcV5_004882 [Antrodia cinnamomea]KAI0962067.1 hypothetical protein AcV7_000990 [Antrodia cinnamomea]KAI0964074.1 hypothetical protein AcW1_000979 [Antrodia cinnamomea]